MAKVTPDSTQAEPIRLSLLYKISCGVGLLGCLLVALAAAFDDWLTLTVHIPPTGLENAIRVGVFYACSDLNGCESDGDAIQQWQRNAAYLYAIAIIMTVLTLVAMAIYAINRNAKWAVFVRHTATTAAFITWIFVFASDFLLVANADNVSPLLPSFNIEFALVISICGGIAFFILGTLIIIDTVFNS